MNTNDLADHYDKLTPEERFRVMLAAVTRGDDAEIDRLIRAGQRIHLSLADHVPYALALYELLILTYIELQEDAALYQEYHARMETEVRTSSEAARSRKRMKRTKPTSKNQTRANDAVEYPAWHHSARIAYGLGFLLKVKVRGWMLFCARLSISPDAFWVQMDLPGLDRLKCATALAHGGAAYPSAEAMLIWVNEVRSAGEPEYTEADILTAEQFAVDLDEMFRQHARWCGGA